MRLRTGLALPVGHLAQAGMTHHIWRSPDSVEQAPQLDRRQDGYNPEFGVCGIGLTCAEACGDGFEACSAKETSMLFCYNPGAGQTCCPGGSGRACGAGFYCVTDPNGGQTYCCDRQLDLSQCALDLGVPTVVTPAPTPSRVTKTVSVTTTTSLSSTSSKTTTSSRLTTTSPATATTSRQSSTTTESSVVYPPTSATTTSLTSSRNANSTTTRGAPTSSVITAEAPSIPAMRCWGMGVAIVGWAVMG